MGQDASFSFQADVSELLKLVIGSLYSHPEIFLRELVSNASDALDKLRFSAIADPKLLEGHKGFEIRIATDAAAGTLTLEDTGIGMGREELVKNLGTIAHSGSRAFVEKMKATKDVSLIGQFGVGFYSAYLVADRVRVVSRAAGSTEAFAWESDAKDTFTITPAEREEVGTSITLFIKPEHKKYLEDWELRQLVRRYSDFVGHPIKMKVEKKDADGAPTSSWDVINRASALWQRSPSEVTKEQYEELYRHVAHDFEPPVAYAHFRIEGSQVFAGILYVPKKPPFDLNIPNASRGVRLYVKRVFIMEDCDQLLPPYLRFVRGVIDSDDLPLNVSRELLQDSSVVRVIKKQIIKKTLERLDELSTESPEAYGQFFESFGPVLKEGIALDGEFRDRIAKLARFKTSKGEGTVSLAEYVARMPLRQPSIYYALGDSPKALLESPYLEALTKRGFEVLLMVDPIDEWAIDALEKFDGKEFASAMRADLELGDAPEDAAKPATETDQALFGKMKALIGDKVKEIRKSSRLTESPCCLVVPEGGHHAVMERLLKSSGREVHKGSRILEVNVEHPIVQSLAQLAEREPDRFGDWVKTLYDQAVLMEGGQLDSPADFARRVNTLLSQAAR